MVDLKKELLKLLEVDEEFRYAVAAKLGLLEILKRLDRYEERFLAIEEELKKLREDFNKLYQKSLEHDKRFEVLEKKLLEHDKRFEEINRRFEAIERKLLEHDKRFEVIERKLLEHDKRFEAIERKLLEHDKRFEAIERKLLEHDKRFEMIERKLLEHDKRFEVIEKRLEEHDKKFNEILEEIRKIWQTLAEHNRRIANVEDLLGALAESTYAKFTLDAILHQCAYEGDRIISWTRNARVNEEEIDLLIVTEKKVFVVEVKVKPKHGDVGKLLAKADVVRKNYPDKRIVAILTGTRIGRGVMEYAMSKGVLVYSW